MAKRGRRPGSVRSAAAGGIDLMQYALAGARARLQDLGREAGELLRHFPQLSGESPFPWGGTTGARRRGRPATAGNEGGHARTEGTKAPARRRKRRMSAEARKRISEAQKKRWAEQKAKQAAGPQAAKKK